MDHFHGRLAVLTPLVELEPISALEFHSLTNLPLCFMICMQLQSLNQEVLLLLVAVPPLDVGDGLLPQLDVIVKCGGVGREIRLNPLESPAEKSMTGGIF